MVVENQIGPQALASQVPAEAVAADGFPMDLALQKRARRAAVGYGLLALYYVAVTPVVLRFVRWGSLHTVTEDLFARAEVLASLLAYIAGNAMLGVAAWFVISMGRCTSWGVLGASSAFTLWAVGSLTVGLVRLAIAPGAQFGSLSTGVSLLLMAGYVACFVTLWRAVAGFNAARALRLKEIEGRIQA